jgi:hypothetical protein
LSALWLNYCSFDFFRMEDKTAPQLAHLWRSRVLKTNV